jgi:hypothetical protein
VRKRAPGQEFLARAGFLHRAASGRGQRSLLPQALVRGLCLIGLMCRSEAPSCINGLGHPDIDDSSPES